MHLTHLEYERNGGSSRSVVSPRTIGVAETRLRTTAYLTCLPLERVLHAVHAPGISSERRVLLGCSIICCVHHARSSCCLFCCSAGSSALEIFFLRVWSKRKRLGRLGRMEDSAVMHGCGVSRGVVLPHQSTATAEACSVMHTGSPLAMLVSMQDRACVSDKRCGKPVTVMEIGWKAIRRQVPLVERHPSKAASNNILRMLTIVRRLQAKFCMGLWLHRGRCSRIGGRRTHGRAKTGRATSVSALRRRPLLVMILGEY